LQHGELMLERENFCRQLEPRADGGPKRGQQGNEQRSHSAENRISLGSATATAATRTKYSVGTTVFLVGTGIARGYSPEMASTESAVADSPGLGRLFAPYAV
jgi:hypothetical protein